MIVLPCSKNLAWSCYISYLNAVHYIHYIVGDENKKQLLDLGAMEHVLHLLQSEDKIVRRNSCMVTGVMTAHRKSWHVWTCLL